VIVGFRNSDDISECLTALSRATAEPSFDIFICENGGRESFHQLSEVLTGPQGPCEINSGDLPKSPISPSERFVDIKCCALRGRSSQVRIAFAAENLGYAGAINAWIRQLLDVPDWDGIWILNPDCKPAPEALYALAQRSIKGNKGMVGSTILRTQDLSRVYCRGGHHWRKFITKLAIIGANEPVYERFDLETIEAALDVISGASMYVTRACIEKIGLMDERFFLYYEDADWSLRAKVCGLGYASASLVPHKGGTSIGSARKRANRSELSVFLESRNRIHFMRKHFFSFVPLGLMMSIVFAVQFLLAGAPRNFWAALMGLAAALKGNVGPPLDRPEFYELFADTAAGDGAAAVAYASAGKTRENRRLDHHAASLGHLPDGRGRGAEKNVPGYLAADQQTATRTDPNARELVLNLHGIGTPPGGLDNNNSRYWLTRQAFTTLLESVMVARAKSKIPIFITFDDGNASDAVIALPELAKRGLKAAFFICANRIGTAHYLDRVAIADLVAAGMEIGTHGMDHRDWARLDETMLNVEVSVARQRIEDVCGMAVTKAAIPFGSYNRRVLKRLRRDRFECVYTSDNALARSGAWLKPRATADNTWLKADIKLTNILSRQDPLLVKAKMLYKSLR
jgi:N-acetylglucosaminyl-diphospho-decaprenol L-rhamnosyltransferase